MIDTAKRISEIEESPTLAITAKAKQMRAEGRDIIGFGAGEPDFDTPENIKDAAVKAINSGQTKYTAVAGIPELKDAIIEKFRRDNQAEYQRDEVLVSCGGKHSIFNLFQSVLNPGDEVLVPAPYWVSYPPMIGLAGGKAVIIPTDESTDFKMLPAQIAEYITPKTRAIIINSPSNPSGAAYTGAEIEALAASALSSGLLIISDEIYEKLVYDDFEFRSVASLGDEVRKNAVVLNGVSKAYSMTGWRIGYAAGPANIIKAMTKFQSQSTSNPTSISQWAAVEALNGPQDAIATMLSEFKLRRDIMVERLNAIDGVHSLTPKGAFYAFPNVSKFYGKQGVNGIIKGSADLAEYLLDTVGVAVIPGVAFGSDPHVRLSYACSMESIKTGLTRIAEALGALD